MIMPLQGHLSASVLRSKLYNDVCGHLFGQLWKTKFSQCFSLPVFVGKVLRRTILFLPEFAETIRLHSRASLQYIYTVYPSV